MTAHKLEPLTDADEARIQEGIRRDPDNPEWTEEDFANAKPFAEVFPDLAASIERDRATDPNWENVFCLDPDVAEKFLATGKGWQRRINDVLRRASIEEALGEDR